MSSPEKAGATAGESPAQVRDSVRLVARALSRWRMIDATNRALNRDHAAAATSRHTCMADPCRQALQRDNAAGVYRSERETSFGRGWLTMVSAWPASSDHRAWTVPFPRHGLQIPHSHAAPLPMLQNCSFDG
jgi:hypothetical protein